MQCTAGLAKDGRLSNMWQAVRLASWQAAALVIIAGNTLAACGCASFSIALTLVLA